MNEPTDGMAKWQSTKQVLAGEIIEVCPAGCYVKNADGDAIFREYVENMTARTYAGRWRLVDCLSGSVPKPFARKGFFGGLCGDTRREF